MKYAITLFMLLLVSAIADGLHVNTPAIQTADIDTFAELDAIVADETLLKWVTAPTSNNAAGTQGQIAFDDNYYYVAISNNVWRRTVMASW